MQLEMNRAKDYIVLAFKDRETLTNVFRVCLFGSKIVWMENFGKKIRRNFFLSVFGWVGRKKINGGVKCFFPRTHQKILSETEKKLKREIVHHFLTKMPMCNKFIHVTSLHTIFFFPLHVAAFFLNVAWLFFFFFWFTGRRCQPLLILFSFLFFFLLIYWAGLSSILFLFFCFLFCFLGLDVIFFYGHDFYFLINLGDWFFWLFIIFLILIGHHF